MIFSGREKPNKKGLDPSTCWMTKNIELHKKLMMEGFEEELGAMMDFVGDDDCGR